MIEREARNWIDGQWVGSADTRSFDPATGQAFGSFSDATLEDAQKAIDAASAAFRKGDWSSDAMLRATALSHMADAYAARLDDVIDTLCLENGKVRREATFEAQILVRHLRFAASLALQNYGYVSDPRPGMQAMSIRQPVGVAGLIIPWNSPAVLAIRALAPALAAGCTAVLKLPQQAAHTAQLMGEIIASVSEIPRGVVNVFSESGAGGAKLLVDSPNVPVISFTGSTATGRLIARAAADRLKRVGLELGGKTPHLVFDDADLEAVLPVLEKSSTVFAGQFCMTGSRILVQRGLSARLKERLARRLEQVRPGPAAEPDSDMGPLIDKASVARVNAMVEDAIAAGAVPLVRGGPSTVERFAGGAFYHPTLLEVSDPSMPVVQKEVFGPVQTLQVFDTEDEAIALANDSEYGLHACIWSRDIDRPLRVARRLEAGLISINSWANIAVEFEEGGFKSSGLGRLGGLASIEDFIEHKQITQNYDGGH